MTWASLNGSLLGRLLLASCTLPLGEADGGGPRAGAGADRAMTPAGPAPAHGSLKVMRVLDLFSGLGGFSQAYLDRAHQVTTVDLDPRFQADVVADVMELTAEDLPGPWDVVLASPPCNCFSTASKHIHWAWGDSGQMMPQGRRVRQAIPLLHHTMQLIQQLDPIFWVVENPVGMGRRVLGEPAVTTYFCSWGRPNKKPTDLWGVIPDNINWPRPRVWAPGKEGTNAIEDPAEKARIPWALSHALAVGMETALEEDDSRRVKRYYKTHRPSGLCEGCETLLPQGHRTNQTNHGPACRTRAWRKRKKKKEQEAQAALS